MRGAMSGIPPRRRHAQARRPVLIRGAVKRSQARPLYGAPAPGDAEQYRMPAPSNSARATLSQIRATAGSRATKPKYAAAAAMIACSHTSAP
jgi:hypothetical protein